MSEMRDDSARLHISKPGKTRRTVIGLAAVTTAVGGIMILSAGTQAVASKSNADNVTLCHATASTTNPYVVITVDPDAIQTKIFGPNGHATHTGPVFDPNGGKNQPAWGDIIPSFTYTQSGSKQVITYPGMNLTAEGLAILANGCKIPTTPSTSPTPPPSSGSSSCTVSCSPSSPPPSSPASSPASTVSLSGSSTAASTSTSPSLGVSASSAHRTTHSQAGTTTAAAPIPAGVSAGLNKPLANAGMKAWGTVLLLLGGASGLFAGLWPTRRRAH